MNIQAYHHLSVQEVERCFKSDRAKGISGKTVQSLLKEYGLNSLESLKAVSAWEILLRQLSNFFVLLLAIAAVISYFVDGPVQAIVLVTIILINVVFGFFQEYKAERALSDLKSSFHATCKVIRGGKVGVVSTKYLVPGDLVLLEAGDKVPADLRIVENNSLQVDESVLTGESVPVSKAMDPLPIETVVNDRLNMVFTSTQIVAGRGRGIVVATGTRTEFGKIAGMIGGMEEKTPLQGEILYLGKVLTLISVAMAALIFGLGFIRGHEVLPLLTFVIALLVGVVPESLPTIITLSLAIGMLRMAKKKAIVRRLGVIEALGSINIIATDKTGTLTENKLKVGMISVWRNGRMERFELKKERGVPIVAKDEIKELLVMGTACSNVVFQKEGELVGDPVETAIVECARDMEPDLARKISNLQRKAELPFNSTDKFMAVMVEAREGSMAVAKGAAEKILEFTDLDEDGKVMVLEESLALSKLGFKVIGTAVKQDADKMDLKAMRFLGLYATVDEPSRGVKEAISKTLQAGIRPLMITGDHPETARYVANKIGLLVSDDEVVTGSQLESLSEAEKREVLQKVKVVARVTPEDKMVIVKTLQDLGFTVAVTGDGVNDAPALKESTVGVAMGIKGTDVARDASDIVLADDHYATIVSAVEYGRTIYDNIRNAVIFFLSSNFDEVLLIGTTFLLGLPLPLLTLQILWINIVSDSFPALAFAFETPTARTLHDKPRSSEASSMRRPILFSFVLAVIAFIIGLTIFLWGLSHSIEKARTLVFMSSVLVELVYAFSLRSPRRIWQDAKSFIANKYMIGALILSLMMQAVVFIPSLSEVFGVVPLSLFEWLVLLICTLAAFMSAEVVKWYLDKHQQALSGRGIVAAKSGI